MQKELALLLPLLEDASVVEDHGLTFHCGTIGGHDVVAMQCGIGKVNAAVGTLSLIYRFEPDYVLNTGVAGGLGGKVPVMDVVAGERVAYHDVWCGPETTRGSIQGLPQYFYADRRLLGALPFDRHIHKGLICSGDQFIDTLRASQKITDNYPGALACDMESGAIAQVCYLRQVPFLSLRVISDSPGAADDSTDQYADFWQEAPQHTFAIVRSVLQQLR